MGESSPQLRYVCSAPCKKYSDPLGGGTIPKTIQAITQKLGFQQLWGNGKPIDRAIEPPPNHMAKRLAQQLAFLFPKARVSNFNDFLAMGVVASTGV